ncbi:MAG: phosphoribosylglycinamide formyltransferase [Ignavibacteriae bacterium]|nr:phosphoribosylglycinamide formyltransferase [Ignavibacteriota bacterium]
MLKLAVFVSGRGSNLAAIVAKIKSGYLSAKVCMVVSNKKECKAFEICIDEKIPTYVVDTNDSYEDLIEILDNENIELIVLAGFLKKIPINLIQRFKNKIINIHPALLPAFGGKGMYGLNVHNAVLKSSSKVSGATIHFVDEIYDNGKIIEQREVDISDVKTAEEIAAKVLKVEHELLPDVIKKFAENKIKY